MSTKNSSYVAAAAAALGLVVNGSPVCEGLLNDLQIADFSATEVGSAGRVIAIVSIVDGEGVGTVRPVADSLGNVKLFMDANAALLLSKRANMMPGQQFVFLKAVKVGSVGDPIAALKAKFKRFKSEAALSLKQQNNVAAKQAAAQALGWDVAVGTPEAAEYVDMVARIASITEWKQYNDAQVTALGASLTAAGIDPLTVV